MPDTHIKVGGAWKAIDNASVKVSGAWKQVNSIYIKVSGAWKKVWTNWVVSFTGSSVGGNGEPPPTVGFRFNSTGTIETNNGSGWTGSTNWVTPTGAASEETFHIRFTATSGPTANWVYDVGGALVDGTTWHALSSTRTITGHNNATGSATVSILAEVSADGGSTVEDSGTFSLDSSDFA